MPTDASSNRPRGGKRAALLRTAEDLFARRGFHATGIDAILGQAGFAKMTLYKHFASKEALIVAVLERRHEAFMAWLDGALGPEGAPETRLLRVFEAYEAWFKSDRYDGCLFVRACAEYPDPAHPIHQAAARHKHRLYDYIFALVQATGIAAPQELARAVMLLLEGAITVAYVSSAPIAARRAGQAARALLAQAQRAA